VPKCLGEPIQTTFYPNGKPKELSDGDKWGVAVMGSIASGGSGVLAKVPAWIKDLGTVSAVGGKASGELEKQSTRSYSGPKPVKVETESTWGNTGTLQKHFEKHGSDFSSKNSLDYAEKANDFYNRAQNGDFRKIVGEDGAQRYYDPAGNTFGSYNKDGTTRTFFKPENGSQYWENQINNSSKNVVNNSSKNVINK